MCYGWVWTVCSRSIDYTLLCNKLLRWAKVAWVFSNCTFISVLILYVGNIYIGTANNAGAILVVGRGLVVVPKLIHPLPPPLQSPETSPERVMDDTWMQASFLKFSTLQIAPWCQNEFRTTYSQVFLHVHPVCFLCCAGTQHPKTAYPHSGSPTTWPWQEFTRVHMKLVSSPLLFKSKVFLDWHGWCCTLWWTSCKDENCLVYTAQKW